MGMLTSEARATAERVRAALPALGEIGPVGGPARELIVELIAEACAEAVRDDLYFDYLEDEIELDIEHIPGIGIYVHVDELELAP